MSALALSRHGRVRCTVPLLTHSGHPAKKDVVRYSHVNAVYLAFMPLKEIAPVATPLQHEARPSTFEMSLLSADDKGGVRQ